MKQVWIILGLVALVSAQCDTNYAWNNLTQTCNANQLHCALNLDCFPTGNGVCRLTQQGQACNSDNDCGGYFVHCVDKQCDNKRYAGDQCISSTQCWSGLCDKGICGGIDELLPCTPSSAACGKGLYCTPAGKCAKRIKAGNSCANPGTGPNYQITCQLGAYCDTNTDTCTKFGSIPAGQSCGSSDGCAAGYYCRNGQCTRTTAGNTCSNNNDCNQAPNVYCLCANSSSLGTCKSVVDLNCTLDSYYKCLDDNGCENVGPLNNNTCAAQNCQCKYVQYLSCQQKNSVVPVQPIDDITSVFPECVSGSPARKIEVLVALFALFLSAM